MEKIEFKDLPDTTTPLTATNFNTLQDNVEAEFESLNPQYTTSTTITPGFDCYAEVTMIFSAWSYDGNTETVGISCSNNPVELARANTILSGHNTVPDAGICKAVYEFSQNETYQLSHIGHFGGNGSITYITKLVRKI